MNIPEGLYSEFAKVTNDRVRTRREYNIYGTVSSVTGGVAVVTLDGGETTTYCASGVSVAKNDRVIVAVKNRKPNIIANLTKKTVNIGATIAPTSTSSGGSGDYTPIGGAGVNHIKGELLIGDPDEDAALTVASTSKSDITNIYAGCVEVKLTSGGKSELTPSGVSTTSDERLKTDITDLDPELAMRLRPVSFRFKDEYEDVKHYGFIAQEVEGEIPKAVVNDVGGYLSLIYSELIAPTLALAQKNAREIEALKLEIEELKMEVRNLGQTEDYSVPAEE